MKALQAQQAAEAAMASSDEDPDEAELADEIRAKRMIMKKASRREKGKNRPTLPRKAKRKPASEFAAHLESLGIRTDTAVKHQLPHTTRYTNTNEILLYSYVRALCTRAHHTVGSGYGF